MTISLTVILIESTNEISYGLPIMITLMVLQEFFFLLMCYFITGFTFLRAFSTSVLVRDTMIKYFCRQVIAEDVMLDSFIYFKNNTQRSGCLKGNN